MEDHLNNKDRLDKEWEALCAYKAENVSTTDAQNNSARNRSQYAVPCKFAVFALESSKQLVCFASKTKRSLLKTKKRTCKAFWVIYLGDFWYIMLNFSQREFGKAFFDLDFADT